jgi:hypothetical protein
VNNDVRRQIPPPPRRLSAAGLGRLRLFVFGQSAQMRGAEILIALVQALGATVSLMAGGSRLSVVLFAGAAATCAVPFVRRLVCGARVGRLRLVCERGAVAVGTLTQSLWSTRWTAETKRTRPVCTVRYRFTDDRGREQSKRETIWSGIQPVPCETGSEIVVLFDQLDPRHAIAPLLHGINFE